VQTLVAILEALRVDHGVGARVARPMAWTLVKNAISLPLLLRLIQFLLSGTLYPAIRPIDFIASYHFQIIPTVFEGFFIITEWDIVWLGFICLSRDTFLVLDVVKFHSLLFIWLSVQSRIADRAFTPATKDRGSRSISIFACKNKWV